MSEPQPEHIFFNLRTNSYWGIAWQRKEGALVSLTMVACPIVYWGC